VLPLKDIGVLVTRPRHQAEALCRMLEAEGAEACRFPTVEIFAAENRPAALATASSLADYELIIFVSANAVRFGAALLDQKRDLALAAVGPATAHALNQAGYRVSVQPEERFDSLGLLEHPKLHAVAGSRILLVKGNDGRDLLERELARRGAQVSVAEVYRRECSRPSAEQIARLERRFAEQELHVITATSLEIGANLLALATPALRRAFDAVRWVVPGARVAASLRERGVGAELLVARSAADQDLLAAVLDWRAGESGA
jgi:uroporphyrinogen-III synthase